MLKIVQPILILLFASIELMPLTSFGERQNSLGIRSKKSQANNIKDYGVHGHLFDIAEESLINEIMAKLNEAQREGKLEQLQNEFANKVKAKVLRPSPVLNITKAQENRSWTYTPSYTQETDITNGKGKIIVSAGTTVNGLDKLKWGQPMIFIDGDDLEQINWISRIEGKIVLTNGSPLELAKTLGRPVYFDQGGILCRRFNIESVPAIVEQEERLLRVREVKI